MKIALRELARVGFTVTLVTTLAAIPNSGVRAPNISWNLRKPQVRAGGSRPKPELKDETGAPPHALNSDVNYFFAAA